MADEDFEDELLPEEELGRTIRRNPTIDGSIPLTDEQYASREWWRFSHEANTFAGSIDSRITDREVENDDRAGVRFYVPIYELELEAEGAEKDAVEFNSNLFDKGGKLADLNSGIMLWFTRNFVQRLIGKSKSKSPILNAEAKQIALDRLWHDFYTNRIKQARELLKLKPGDELPREKEIYEEAVAQIKASLASGTGLKVVRKWRLTPMSIGALPQTPRKPFFMIYKRRLDELYREELQLQTNDPDEPVSYNFTGCVIPDDRDPTKLVSVDERLVSFIRADGGAGLPPFPLIRHHRNSFMVPRRYEDERALTLRAHQRGAREMETAERVYYWENRAKTDTGYYDGHPIFSLLPAGSERSDEAAFAFIAQQERVYRTSGGTAGWTQEDCLEKAKFLREYYESWLEENFDRWLPSEQYEYRNRFFDKLSYHGTDWESKADRIWDVMGMQIFVISSPTVTNPFTNEVDWSTFQVYIAPVENRRDVVRLYNHWKMSKSVSNTRASADLNDADIKIARRQDWGGLWTGIKSSDLDWRFLTLKEAAEANPDRALDLLGPIWSKRQLHEPMDHDGALISRFGVKWDNFLTALRTIRFLSSKAGLGQFPRWDKLVEKELVEVRSYRSEYYWLLHDEYTTRDPVDAWKNQGGIINFSMFDEVNVRLDGPYATVPQLRLRYSNGTDFRRFLTLMWYYQPVGPLEEGLTHELEEAEADHEEETLSDLAKKLKGLPGKVVPQIQAIDESGQLIWDVDGAGNRIPAYLLGRDEVEKMIERLRRRAIFWMIDRIPEKIFPGHMRHFTEAGKWLSMGWPWRIGDDEESTRLFQAALTQVWHCKVYDILNGKANVQETPETLWMHGDNVEWTKSKINNGGLNPHYATGYQPQRGKPVWLIRQQEVAEYLCLWAQFPVPNETEQETRTGFTYEVATMILDKTEWEVVERKLQAADYDYNQIRRVWGVYCTYQDTPVRM